LAVSCSVILLAAEGSGGSGANPRHLAVAVSGVVRGVEADTVGGRCRVELSRMSTSALRVVCLVQAFNDEREGLERMSFGEGQARHRHGEPQGIAEGRARLAARAAQAERWVPKVGGSPRAPRRLSVGYPSSAARRARRAD